MPDCGCFMGLRIKFNPTKPNGQKISYVEVNILFTPIITKIPNINHGRGFVNKRGMM